MGSQQLGDSNEDTVRCGRFEGNLFKRMYLRYILVNLVPRRNTEAT